MIIKQIQPQDNDQLRISSGDDRIGFFDVFLNLKSEAFTSLKDTYEFSKIHN